MRGRTALWRTVAAWGTVPIAIGAALSAGSLGPIGTSAAPGATQTLQSPTYLGTGSLADAGSGSFVDSIYDATAGGADSATRPAGASSASASTPDPGGRRVTVNNAGGFAGLTHLDQRTAGTGIYKDTQFTLEPPDQGLCVGGGFVLESVNTAFEVFDAHGKALTKPEAFNQFFKVQPEVIRTVVPNVRADFLSDPKCNYDVATQRWFMTILQLDAPGTFPPCAPADCSRAHTFVAVSQGSDPRGGWNLFSIDATDDGTKGTPKDSNPLVQCPCFGDQPLLGMNADALFISTNEYGTPTSSNTNPNNPEIGGQIYAVSKWGIEHASGVNLPKVVHINAGSLPIPSGDCTDCAPFDSIQPATSPTGNGQTEGSEYFLSSFTNNTTTNHRINTWVVTGTDTLRHSHPELDIQRVQIGSEAYVDDLPVGAPGLGGIAVTQKDGPRPLGTAGGDPLAQINANDVRMNQVVFADGKLWSGVNTALKPAGKTARSGIAYFVVQPSFEDSHLSAEMANQGYVAVKGNSTLFPSVGVNQDGNGAIAFSVVGPDYFPSAGYVRINSDGDLSGKIVISGAGVAPEDGFTGYASQGFGPVARWGDYSAAVAATDGSIWMAAEWIPGTPRTLLANWGTFITHINADH